MAPESRLVRTAPPLAALAYPGVVWCGTAVSPLFLVAALGVPLVGAVVARHTGERYPRSRAVAMAVVAAPPLFSWLGGLLDFQTSLPFHAISVWTVLWSALLAATLVEQPAEPTPARLDASRLAFAHGLSAVILTTFATAHIANHLAGLWGGDTHIAMMNAFRQVYRQPIVEAVLLGAVAFQAGSGLRLLAVKPVGERTWPDTLQRVSAVYLAVFLLSHLTAALRARHLRGVDTNWTWLTSDSMLTDPWSARLAPYYLLSILALGIHGGLGLRHVLLGHGVARATADRAALAAGLGALAASALVMTGLLRA
jgi:succinate dehydrogenase/fumarate reductase cytochrome b subunit